MSEHEASRLIAWNRELQEAHTRLREALRVARDAVGAGEDVAVATTDLRTFCHGFCVALDGHHTGEDSTLFPELAAQHPELRPTIVLLEQDHAMIGSLLTRFDAAIRADEPPAELSRHLEGLAAIMESHFRFEERKLLDVLATLEFDADVRAVLGPL